jgi:hypothetical protein
LAIPINSGDIRIFPAIARCIARLRASILACPLRTALSSGDLMPGLYQPAFPTPINSSLPSNELGPYAVLQQLGEGQFLGTHHRPLPKPGLQLSEVSPALLYVIRENNVRWRSLIALLGIQVN